MGLSVIRGAHGGIQEVMRNKVNGLNKKAIHRSKWNDVSLF